MASDDVPTPPLTGPDGLVTPREAVVRGSSGSDLRAAHAAGRLVRVRTGVYAEADRWDALDGTGRYRLRVLAAGRRLADPLFSHDSAAVVWRLPKIGRWPGAVHVTVPATSVARSFHDVRRHRVPRYPDHAVEVDGVRITGVARTVVDVARCWSFGAGLASADHALRLGWTTRERLERELARVGAGAGSRTARRVIGAASALAESPGESLSRAHLLDLGLPLPVLQHEVRDGEGAVGRVDFWWPDLGLVGEFDGRRKYRADGVDDQRAVEERVWAEKRREDRLRAAGLGVVRWTWSDLLAPHRLAELLARAGLHP